MSVVYYSVRIMVSRVRVQYTSAQNTVEVSLNQRELWLVEHSAQVIFLSFLPLNIKATLIWITLYFHYYLELTECKEYVKPTARIILLP